MKKILLLLCAFVFSFYTYSQKISSFYDFGTSTKTLSAAKEDVKAKLTANGFKITGGYFVGGKKNMYVLTVSSRELQSACYKVKDKGLLAANLRVGFIVKSNTVDITALNPEYLFIGYLRDAYFTQKNLLKSISNKFLGSLKSINNKQVAFGGSLEAGKLKKYHYMMGMPYFDDYIELKEFKSFDDAISTISNNLKNKKSNTRMVYKLVYKKSKKAVIGVGLLDKEKGESHFLPIIGEKHLAAMPYEIVIEGNKAYMLHGRFRFAMYWPELSMSQFSKIMSTPGDIEDILKSLTE